MGSTPKHFELKDLENELYSTVDILSNDEDFVDEYAWEEMNMLVVDDSPLAQRMVCKVLGYRHYKNRFSI